MYSEVISIYSVKAISDLFLEQGAICQNCGEPLNLKIQESSISCKNCKFVLGILPKKRIKCPRCKDPLQINVHVSTVEQTESLCKKFNPETFFCKFRAFSHSNPENNFEVVFGVQGKLCEIFDLEQLKKDYAYFRDIVEDIESKKDRNLSDYAYCWDIDEGAELWETGLILGYPIENTISLYYRDRFKL